MLRNLHLIAIVKADDEYQLLRIPLHRQLQESLAVILDVQLRTFVEGIQEVEFDAGYNPEEQERFRIADFQLPDYLNQYNSLNVGNIAAINDQEGLIESVKGIAAFARNEHREELILFQNFNSAHVIRPGRFMFLRNDTYESSERPGLTLDGKLAAVYFGRDQRLLFSNFRITNTFLPLAEYYEEANEHTIRAVLNHQSFLAEDQDALAIDASQWFRKRFALLRDSGILDEYTVPQIVERSRNYRVEIQLDGNRIVFPADRTAAKKLLQFLNEELFRGAITETLYETNSKRAAEE